MLRPMRHDKRKDPLVIRNTVKTRSLHFVSEVVPPSPVFLLHSLHYTFTLSLQKRTSITVGTRWTLPSASCHRSATRRRRSRASSTARSKPSRPLKNSTQRTLHYHYRRRIPLQQPRRASLVVSAVRLPRLRVSRRTDCTFASNALHNSRRAHVRACFLLVPSSAALQTRERRWVVLCAARPARVGTTWRA